MADERAVSVPTNYVVILAIVTVLSTGLFVASAEFVDTQQQQAVRSGLDRRSTRQRSRDGRSPRRHDV